MVFWLLTYRQWFDWLACDIAGDMGYGHNFNNVQDSQSPLIYGELELKSPQLEHTSFSPRSVASAFGERSIK